MLGKQGTLRQQAADMTGGDKDPVSVYQLAHILAQQFPLGSIYMLERDRATERPVLQAVLQDGPV